jgi:ribosomal protein S25
MTIDEVLAELEGELNIPEAPPDCAFTVYDIMDKYGITFNQARSRLRNLERAGKIKQWPHIWERKAYYYVPGNESTP